MKVFASDFANFIIFFTKYSKADDLQMTFCDINIKSPAISNIICKFQALLYRYQLQKNSYARKK